ncbi:MAG: hypothetical protein JO235_19675 [Chroococcidiopsidaceae cyanobacterium CP_BM_RX_35]|nr:hypothetical protein [Chroococcidiopsidaceae cyanobacterium CP_BM_RX_35]
MQTKLTLRIDQQLIAKAKRVAGKKGMSVSQMVAKLIETIPETEVKDEDLVEDLDPWTKSLYGVASSLAQMSDEELEEDYINYLEEKSK